MQLIPPIGRMKRLLFEDTMNNPSDEPGSSAEPSKKCPVCHLINPGTAQVCDCGYSFETHLRGKSIEGSTPWHSPAQLGQILSPKARFARIIRCILGVGFVAIGLVEIYNFKVSPGDRIGWAWPGIRTLFMFGPLLLIIGSFLIFYRRPVARGSQTLLWIGCALIAVPLLFLVLFMATSRSPRLINLEILSLYGLLALICLGLPGLVFVAIGLWQRSAPTRARRRVSIIAVTCATLITAALLLGVGSARRFGPYPYLPVNGAQAITQGIDGSGAVAADGAGGFYVSSEFQNRIYRVAANGSLSLTAGLGTSGFSGDGGPATTAQLRLPDGVTVDSAGNLYIADKENNRIRKITNAGIISTVAGNGTRGFSGDGGPATAAQLYNPTGVAIDSAGNLYIADPVVDRIRKVTTTGIISTVAGNRTRGFSGDGGLATAAQLFLPTGVAVDSAGNLYIADEGNVAIGDSGSQRIHKVTTAGIISTVAGNGTRGFSGDGGLATAAQLNFPSGVAVDSAGNLYIADKGNKRIRRVTTAGIISTVAGNGNSGT